MLATLSRGWHSRVVGNETATQRGASRWSVTIGARFTRCAAFRPLSPPRVVDARGSLGRHRVATPTVNPSPDIRASRASLEAL